MFYNYFKIAVRNLFRKKIYSLINIIGLAVGLACCMLILLFVRDELSYDQHHTQADRIWRIAADFNQSSGGFAMAYTSYRLAPALREDFGAYFEKVVRISPTWQTLVKHGEHVFQEEKVALADPEIWDVFTLPLLKGDEKTALQDPFTVVISRSAAQKYFGEEDPIGKVLLMDEEHSVIITGLMEDMPANSHFHFDFLVSMRTGDEIFPDIVLNNWGEMSQVTYALLRPEATQEEVEALFPAFLDKHTGEGASESARLFLQPIRDIHLHSQLQMEMEPNGDIQYVYIFSIVALIILLIACINYMNLATARSATRAKEIGMRKVSGASRAQLVQQFLSESLVIVSIAAVLAVIFTELSLPVFNQLAGKSLEIHWFADGQLLWSLLGIVLLVSLIAGSYPAFFLSAFQPTAILKDNRGSSQGRFSLLLRKGLVVMQFAISIFLIIGTVTIFRQLHFLRNKQLGLDKEQVVVMPIQVDSLSRDYPLLKEQLLRHPQVVGVTASNKRLTRRLGSFLGHTIDSVDPTLLKDGVRTVTVDPDFFSTLGVEIVEGRDFSREYGTDLTEAFILNETAVKEFGLTDPIGKRVETSTLNSNRAWEPKTGTVIGVVRDFHYESLQSKIAPVVFSVSEVWLDWMSIRLRGGDIPEALDLVESTCATFAPGQPFQYTFLEEDVHALYASEDRFLRIFGIFAFIAIFIASLGVWGLASYTAEQRTKEIGIRKVLGASILDITTLLSREFALLVLLAALLSCPLAWYFSHQWLTNFPYRTEMSVFAFLLAVAAAFLIALTTVAYQAIKAALANPVHSIKYE